MCTSFRYSLYNVTKKSRRTCWKNKSRENFPSNKNSTILYLQKDATMDIKKRQVLFSNTSNKGAQKLHKQHILFRNTNNSRDIK
jgi:hypothetical protein